MRTRYLALNALRAGGGATVGLVLLSVTDTATRLAVPALIGTAVDQALAGGAGNTLVIAVIALLCLGIAAESLTELSDYSARVRALRTLRSRLLGHLFRLGFRGQRKFSHGDLVNRLTASTDQTAQAANLVTRILVPLMTSIGGIAALFAIDYRIGLVFLAASAVLMALTLRHLPPITSLSTTAAAELAKVSTRLLDAVRGMRTIRASGTVESETERVLRPAEDLRSVSLRIWQRQRSASWEAAMYAPLLQVLVLGTAGYGLVHGGISPGELMSVSFYVGYGMGIFQQAGSLRDIGQLTAASRRVSTVLEEPGLPTGTRPLPEGNGALRFESVGSEVGGRPILRDVTFDVPAGATVAIVGESGVGKTTLTAMAGGLLAPDEGTVTFDGAPIGELRNEELRAAVTYAYERPHLLGTTIADALRYGNDTITDAQLRAALRSTGAEDFVARLPAQTGTQIADLALSGGELQRLGLARAACRPARLVIMDDALSSVDTATEAVISSALQQALRGSTRLLIAHRMSTAARADSVVWLHNGTLAGTGTHRELMAEPAYRAVFGAAERAESAAATFDRES